MGRAVTSQTPAGKRRLYSQAGCRNVILKLLNYSCRQKPINDDHLGQVSLLTGSPVEDGAKRKRQGKGGGGGREIGAERG